MPSPIRFISSLVPRAIARLFGKSIFWVLLLVQFVVAIRTLWSAGTRMADPAAPSPAWLLAIDLVAVVLAILALVLLYRDVAAFFQRPWDDELGRGGMPISYPDGPDVSPGDQAGVTAPIGPRRPPPLAAHAWPD